MVEWRTYVGGGGGGGGEEGAWSEEDVCDCEGVSSLFCLFLLGVV